MVVYTLLLMVVMVVVVVVVGRVVAVYVMVVYILLETSKDTLAIHYLLCCYLSPLPSEKALKYKQ